MKPVDLINEITSSFENALPPRVDYIVTEYNSLIKTLLLMLPDSDGVLKVTADGGVLQTDLSAQQIKRVLWKNSELLRASDTLRSVLPGGMLYTPKDNLIYVTVSGECTVFYRVLPEDVTAESLDAAEFTLDSKYIPLVRAWLWHRVYLYVGDIDSANVYAEEFNRLLEEYKVENGVAVCA